MQTSNTNNPTSTTTSNLPLVAVWGASGSQGGSVVRALSATGRYKIRAISRKPHSEAAKKLCELPNVECVRGDLNNPEEIGPAVKGCWAVFGVTNFWDAQILADHKVELTQGKNLVDACDAAGVKYFIFSSLAPVHEESHGRLTVPHFDQKHHIQKYAQTKQNMKSMFVYPGMYMQNFQTMMPPKKTEDGTVMFAFPINDDTLLYLYDAIRDTGLTVQKLLENPDQWINQDITICGDALTGQQLAETFSRVTGKKAVFKALTKEDFKASVPHHMFEEMWQMFQWFCNFGYFGNRSPWVARDKLGVPMNNFESWLRESNWTGPQ